MKTWEAQIPKTPKFKERKRCYTAWYMLSEDMYWGGGVVWLTNKQRTFHIIKNPGLVLKEILEKDQLEENKKYMDQTLD
jgi:hypothetical protein